MSVRIEWHERVKPTVKKKGYRAADGNKVTADLCLFMGGAAYEGTLEDLMWMIEVARNALIKAEIEARHPEEEEASDE